MIYFDEMRVMCGIVSTDLQRAAGESGDQWNFLAKDPLFKFFGWFYLLVWGFKINAKNSHFDILNPIFYSYEENDIFIRR